MLTAAPCSALPSRPEMASAEASGDDVTFPVPEIFSGEGKSIDAFLNADFTSCPFPLSGSFSAKADAAADATAPSRGLQDLMAKARAALEPLRSGRTGETPRKSNPLSSPPTSSGWEARNERNWNTLQSSIPGPASTLNPTPNDQSNHPAQAPALNLSESFRLSTIFADPSPALHPLPSPGPPCLGPGPAQDAGSRLRSRANAVLGRAQPQPQPQPQSLCGPSPLRLPPRSMGYPEARMMSPSSGPSGWEHVGRIASGHVGGCSNRDPTADGPGCDRCGDEGQAQAQGAGAGREQGRSAVLQLGEGVRFSTVFQSEQGDPTALCSYPAFQEHRSFQDVAWQRLLALGSIKGDVRSASPGTAGGDGSAPAGHTTGVPCSSEGSLSTWEMEERATHSGASWQAAPEGMGMTHGGASFNFPSPHSGAAPASATTSQCTSECSALSGREASLSFACGCGGAGEQLLAPTQSWAEPGSHVSPLLLSHSYPDASQAASLAGDRCTCAQSEHATQGTAGGLEQGEEPPEGRYPLAAPGMAYSRAQPHHSAHHVQNRAPMMAAPAGAPITEVPWHLTPPHADTLQPHQDGGASLPATQAHLEPATGPLSMAPSVGAQPVAGLQIVHTSPASWDMKAGAQQQECTPTPRPRLLEERLKQLTTSLQAQARTPAVSAEGPTSLSSGGAGPGKQRSMSPASSMEQDSGWEAKSGRAGAAAATGALVLHCSSPRNQPATSSTPPLSPAAALSGGSLGTGVEAGSTLIGKKRGWAAKCAKDPLKYFDDQFCRGCKRLRRTSPEIRSMLQELSNRAKEQSQAGHGNGSILEQLLPGRCSCGQGSSRKEAPGVNTVILQLVMLNCGEEGGTAVYEPKLDGLTWRKYGDKSPHSREGFPASSGPPPSVSAVAQGRLYYKCTKCAKPAQGENQPKAAKKMVQPVHPVPGLFLLRYEGDHTHTLQQAVPLHIQGSAHHGGAQPNLARHVDGVLWEVDLSGAGAGESGGCVDEVERSFMQGCQGMFADRVVQVLEYIRAALAGVPSLRRQILARQSEQLD